MSVEMSEIELSFSPGVFGVVSKTADLIVVEKACEFSRLITEGFLENTPAVLVTGCGEYNLHANPYMLSYKIAIQCMYSLTFSFSDVFLAGFPAFATRALVSMLARRFKFNLRFKF
jgi:hypothetical protein